MISMSKKFRLSQKNKKLAGVFGGLGDYFDVDPIILRLAFIFLCFFNPVLILFYPLAVLIIPRQGKTEDAIEINKDSQQE